MKKLIFILLLMVAVAIIILYINKGRTDKNSSIWRVERFENRTQVTSPSLLIDTIYRSMMGPLSNHRFKLTDQDSPKVVWITSYTTTLINERGDTLPSDLMCHNNLNTNPNHLYKQFHLDNRVNTISQRAVTTASGQHILRFPDGFGLPVLSDNDFDINVQALNHNWQDTLLKVKHRTEITYSTDSSIQPLFPRHVYIQRPVEGEQTDPFQGYCSPAPTASVLHVMKDSSGIENTSHWVVEPGVEELNYNVTTMLDLPYDTRVHYIGVHLHPFAEHLELIDITDSITIFKTSIKNYAEKIGIDNITYFSNNSGIPLYADHQYALNYRANNTTDTIQDMMAAMYLYLLDKELQQNL